jgi:Kef-type K+ transport system membrane component KefB
MVDKITEAKFMATPVFDDPVVLSVELSIAILLLAGKLGSILANFIHLPPIIGYLLAGIAIEDYLNVGLLKGCGGNGPKVTPQGFFLFIFFYYLFIFIY